MPVYPLSQGPITRQQQRYDVTLASFVGVLYQRTFEPANFERASQRVDLESPDGLRDRRRAGVDADHVVCLVCTYYRHRVRRFGVGSRQMLDCHPSRIIMMMSSSIPNPLRIFFVIQRGSFCRQHHTEHGSNPPCRLH